MNNLNIRNFKTKLTALVLSGTMIGTLTACNKEEVKEENTTSIEISDNTTKILTDIDKLTAKLNDDLSGKFYLNSDDQKTSMILLNLDYIIKNHDVDSNGNYVSNALNELYPNGLNPDKELNDMNTFISKYREYITNLNSSNGFIGVSEYAIIKTDKIILGKLESIVKDLIDLVNNNGSKEEISSLFNIIYDFFVKEGTLTIDGKTYIKDDLSNGASKMSEVFGNITSVITRNYIKTDVREVLDKNLDSSDSLYNIQVLLEKFANTNENTINMLINGVETEVLDETDIELIESIEKQYTEVMNGINGKFKATTEEVEAIVKVARIDYLASDKVSVIALKTILGEENINDILTKASRFIKKAENYNLNNPDDLYLYNDLFINSEEDIINKTAVKGTIVATLKLRLDSSNLASNTYFNFLQHYNGFDSRASYITENQNKIVKNDTGYGTRFITDTMCYYTYTGIKTESNAYLIDNAIIYVTNTKENPFNAAKGIGDLVDEKCKSFEMIK